MNLIVLKRQDGRYGIFEKTADGGLIDPWLEDSEGNEIFTNFQTKDEAMRVLTKYVNQYLDKKRSKK